MSNSVRPHRRQPTRLPPPSLGFSRQEHWSGLPWPSPMHGREKGKGSHSVVSDSSRPHGLQPTRLLRPWDFPGKSTGVGCHCLLLIQSRFIIKKKRKEKNLLIKKMKSSNIMYRRHEGCFNLSLMILQGYNSQ